MPSAECRVPSRSPGGAAASQCRGEPSQRYAPGSLKLYALRGACGGVGPTEDATVMSFLERRVLVGGQSPHQMNCGRNRMEGFSEPGSAI